MLKSLLAGLLLIATTAAADPLPFTNLEDADIRQQGVVACPSGQPATIVDFVQGGTVYRLFLLLDRFILVDGGNGIAWLGRYSGGNLQPAESQPLDAVRSKWPTPCTFLTSTPA